MGNNSSKGNNNNNNNNKNNNNFTLKKINKNNSNNKIPVPKTFDITPSQDAAIKAALVRGVFALLPQKGCAFVIGSPKWYSQTEKIIVISNKLLNNNFELKTSKDFANVNKNENEYKHYLCEESSKSMELIKQHTKDFNGVCEINIAIFSTYLSDLLIENHELFGLKTEKVTQESESPKFLVIDPERSKDIINETKLCEVFSNYYKKLIDANINKKMNVFLEQLAKQTSEKFWFKAYFPRYCYYYEQLSLFKNTMKNKNLLLPKLILDKIVCDAADIPKGIKFFVKDEKIHIEKTQNDNNLDLPTSFSK